VVCCWGLEESQELSIIRNIAKHASVESTAGVDDDDEEMEVDQFAFKISTEKPSISNDVVTLHRKAAADHRVKLAISYALSQVRVLVGGVMELGA